MTTRSGALLVALAFVLSGCSSGGSSPTPGGSSVVLQELTRAGFRIRGAVAGDAGCDDASLANNATHLRLSLGADEQERDLYLFIFRVRDFAGEGALVDDCRAAAERAANGVFDLIDVPPYRAFGGAWTPAWREALTRALTSAASGGASR